MANQKMRITNYTPNIEFSKTRREGALRNLLQNLLK